MLLRMSTLLLKTLREEPADAEAPSHRLLLRAGYIRRAAPGGYTWLPLGKLVLDRVTAVVREEMTAAGGQEVSFPALLPREPYDVSGRWTEYGDDIFTLQDRRGADHLLAPTHEEMFTLLVQDLTSSYRDFPLVLFQIQTKFRDEARPRGGLLRGREFLMKDAYSFDLTDAGLAEAYQRMREAYQRVFERLGLEHTIVSAVSGAMGGSASEEFLATSEVGEDTFVGCAACSYAANTEAVTTPVSVTGTSDLSLEVHDTPDTPTIASLVDHANAHRLRGRADWTAADTLKNVVVTVHHPGREPELLAIGVPGDREVDMKRLNAALAPATATLFDDFAARPDLVKGYIGPQGLKVRYLADPRVADGTAWLTGANEPGRHATGVVAGRDFTPDGTIEAAEVRAGDPCPRCADGTLTIRRGIEIGHIFQLGRRYTDAFKLDVLAADGKPVRPTMGSYGIGLSRAVAAIAEQHHDGRGLVWPRSMAPADVHVVAAGKDGQVDAALTLGATLSRAGLRVLVDDRANISAGVKFTDAELIGIPQAVVVGRRLTDGYGELRDRRTGERRELPLVDIAGVITARLG
ncbi:putative prolyl-tRNA synthetase [Actinoplanes missouriensis 431]|uniref:Proline--tRNA ligase n=1 Tax=Actinoplanes missouriensis (strain ATCC 14538 / DSM 43046 / CBS 188.64 / JCM 3121 / NBRC 102363 / NCIMB 12654 / NRRL B-3342 / UNCC 431) TaxID=512565 RepID=I0GWV2_ACTM4|nr:proline--tRNA ligase [Actinoplanes missouriensis]BAL85239.1 putative prolyl-tRNA synthetase [Actinoplanes missouriensis 431]